MITNKNFVYIGVFLFVLVLGVGVFAATNNFANPTNNWQAQQPTFNQLYAGDMQNYWPILSQMEDGQCNATTDFVIGIPPGGCSPMVVRSDLLEEQNVPVFCQLYAIQVNPLIKVSSIKSISFKGDYPEGVRSIVFHPARAAVKSYTTLLGDPVINNIGYVVIILKQEKVEKNMPEWIAGNLTATITYDAEDAYGTGAAEYYLPAISDEEWERDYSGSAFWNGRGYLRTMSVGEGMARIQVLVSKDKVLRTFNLKEGETSSTSYLPDYYCKAGLKVRLNDIVAPENESLLNIDGDTLWVREGTKFLNGKCSVYKLDSVSSNSGSIDIKCSGAGTIKTLQLRGKEEGSIEEEYVDSKGNKGLVEEYFVESDKTVKKLVDEYGSETKETKETYGEEALYEQIELARKLGKFDSQLSLIELFKTEYPNSKIIEQIRQDGQKLANTDFSDSFTSVYVGDAFHSISVVGFKNVSQGGESRVDLRIGNKLYPDQKVTNKYEKMDGSEDTFVINEIKPGEIRISFKSSKQGVEGKTVNILEGKSYTFNGIEIYVKQVYVTEVAYVSLIPEVKNTDSKADFTFKVGIEKRGIELSPNKTLEMLANLNESIEKWENIIDRLGNVVYGMKGACFATSAVLMIKNMATGIGGEALARQKVMADKYKGLCDTKYPDKTRTECYNIESVNIDKDVREMTDALNAVNKRMEGAQKGLIGDSGGLFGGKGITDNQKYKEALVKDIGQETVKVKIGNEYVDVPVNSDMSVSQLQSIMLAQQLEGKESSIVAVADRDQALRNVALISQRQEAAEKAAENLNGKLGAGATSSNLVTVIDKDTQIFQGSNNKVGDFSIFKSQTGLDSNARVQPVTYAGVEYVVVLGEEDSKGISGAKDVYEWKDGSWRIMSPKPSEFYSVAFYGFSEGDCSNAWSGDRASVSYYESGRNKGLPAIVPFDLKSGWYAFVPNSGGTFLDDSPQGYTASADVKYFKICNIGANKLMQSGTGDDLCQSFDVNSVSSVDKFLPCPKMNSNEVANLYNKARQAIRSASEQYGQKSINIFDQMMQVGQPMSQVGGFECQDFMSPDDCLLMFNVCDPVICPPTRCDFGEKFPVDDVIQTGVIGSLVLCLPNSKEGIYIPICLSGVHAGLDSYLSILKSERDCLQYSLDSGEMIGICDEITSIYKCEFFWRQLSPVMDQLLPSIVSQIVSPGQSIRGGGEYALVQQSYNTMQQSISYFKDVYAQNAFKAFNIRSTQEVGSTFCKAFVGTSFPASADAIDSLLEPESPTQFYAQFSTTLFTEATVPATAQYKVYYHIYAGNDQGVQYRVYLKDPPASSYYSSSPTINVANGYIAKGQSVDNTEDFTAPDGYKQLCVVINAKEECGFKQVTTDFGLDWVKKKYVEEQAEQSDITSEKECISGSSSSLSAVNLNLQAGAEEMANPEIALRGIVRVCASQSPSQGVSDSRWKDVGYCGDASMRCWLDTDSVENDLKALEALTNKTSSVLDANRGLITDGSMTLEQVQVVLSSSREKIKLLSDSLSLDTPKEGDVKNVIRGLDRIIGGVYDEDKGGAGTNNDRAEALALKASVYRMIVLKAKKSEVVKVKEATVEGTSISEEDRMLGDCEYICSTQNKEFIWYGMTSEECSAEDGGLFGDSDLGCCCDESIAPVAPTEITGEMLYNAIVAAEHRGNYIVETGQFVEGYDPFIRTTAVGSGSTAYGPAQLTMSLAESYLGRADMAWTEDEKIYLNRFVDQGLKFLACGGRGDGSVDPIIFTDEKFKEYLDEYAQFGIKLNTRCYGDLGDYDYGEGGDLSNDMDRAMYKQVVVKMMLDIYNRVEKDTNKFWHAWRFGEGDSGSVDSDYERVFNNAIKLSFSSQSTTSNSVVTNEGNGETISIYYNENLDDFFDYRWNNSKMEAKITTRGYLGILYRTICDWGADCTISKSDADDFEIEMHNRIMKAKSWEDAVSLAKEYKDGYEISGLLSVVLYDKNKKILDIDNYRKGRGVDSGSIKQLVEGEFPFLNGQVAFDLKKLEEIGTSMKYALYLGNEKLPFYFLDEQKKDITLFDSIVSEDGEYSFAMRNGVVNFKKKLDDGIGLGGYDFFSYNGACYSLDILSDGGSITFGKGIFCDEVLGDSLGRSSTAYSDYEECKSSIEGIKRIYGYSEDFCVWKELRSTYKNICPVLTDEDVTKIFSNKEEYREKLSSSVWNDVESSEEFCVPVVYDCVAVFYENEHKGFFGYVHGTNSPVYVNPYEYNGKKYNDKDFYFTVMHEGYHSLQPGVFKILGGFSAFNIDSYYAYNKEVDPRASVIQLWWLEKTCAETIEGSADEIIREGIIYDSGKAEKVLDEFHDYDPFYFERDFENYYSYSNSLKGIFVAYNKLNSEEWIKLKEVLTERLPGIAYGGSSTSSFENDINGGEVMYASNEKNINFIEESSDKLRVVVSLFVPVMSSISGAVIDDGNSISVIDSEEKISPIFFDYSNPRASFIPVKFDVNGVSFFKHPLMKVKFFGRSSIILGHVNIKSKENKLEYKISDADSLLGDLGISEESLVREFMDYHYRNNPCLRFYGKSNDDNCFVFDSSSDIGKIMNYAEVTTCYFGRDKEFKGNGQDFVNGVFDEGDIDAGDYVCSLASEPLVDNNTKWEMKHNLMNSYINYAKSSVFYIDGIEKKCKCGENCNDYISWLYESSSRHGVPFNIALYLMILESECSQDTINGEAYGLMQITENAFEDSCYNEILGYSDFKSKKRSVGFDSVKGSSNSERNIDCGIRHLKTMYDRFRYGVKASWSYKNNADFKKIVDDCIMSEGNDYAEYVEWDAAPRGYNGWGCKKGADPEYIDKFREMELAFSESGLRLL